MSWALTLTLRVAPIAWVLMSGFVALGALQTVAFWFAFAAFVTGIKVLIVVGLGAVTVLTGSVWRLWSPRLFLRAVQECGHV
jgi:hypothetical protein